jgi:hypothetical protein
MHKGKITAIVAASAMAALIVTVPAGAEDASSWSLGGSVAAQPYAAYAGSGSLESSDFSYGSTTTLALDLHAQGGRARAEASGETAVLTGASALAAWAEQASGLARPDELLIPAAAPAGSEPQTLVALRLRTLYVKLDLDWSSLTAGRQVINYNRGILWCPTDLFNELDLTGLSPVRLGSDALRLAVPFDATAGLDLAAAPTNAPADGRYSARLSGLVAGIDGALTMARAGKGWMFGADFKTDLEIGIYGAAAYTLPDSGQAGALRAAAGADWSIGDFIMAAEYYYNGGGADADPLFPGSHNAYASLVWNATELFSLTGTLIWDISDGSGTALLLGSFSAAQNATFQAYLKGGYDPGLGAARARVEAGANIEIKF